MPLELIVLVFALVAFAAIIARFLPRDAAGQRRLPRIVDESVGMYMVRRSLGRPTEAASDLAKVGVDATAEVPEDEIAYRIGVPGAPEPTVPTRFVVSQGQPQAHPIPPVVPITTRPVVGGRPQARRRGAVLVPFQRQIAGLGTLVAILLVGFAAVSVPRAPEEAVLSATGTPGATPVSSELAFVPPPPPTEAPVSEPTTTASTSPTAPTTASPSAATPPPAVATQAVTPTRPRPTPRPTPRSTPAPTPPPTPPPTPEPTPAPTPPPPPDPTPTPTPLPPIAVIACSSAGLTVTCTGDGSSGASLAFSFVFEQGPTIAGNPASHTYADAGQYIVTLTVTDDLGQTSSDSDTITIP